MQFVLTNAGQLIIQANPGVAPTLHSFKLGSSFGYTPSTTQTELVGTEVHSGSPSSPVIQASNLVKYTIYLDFSLGNFNFGEVGLYTTGNVLFAIGTSTTQIQKIKSTVNSDGNSLSIDCYVPTSGTSYSVYAELGNSDININIPAIANIDSLPPAYTAIPNTYQVSSPGQLSSVLAFSNNSRWSITGYDTEIHQQLTVVSGSTASTLIFSQIATNPTTVGELLIQGVTGLNAGCIRVISGYSAGTNAYSVITSFLHQPQVGDTFSVVRRNYLTPTAIGFINGLNPGVGAGQTNGLQSIDLNKIFMTDGSRPAINNLNFANYRLTNVGDPTSSKDAVHRQWLDTAISNFNSSVVTPIANAPRVQIGIGAPLGTLPTTPPFYADKSVSGRYDLYINDPSTSAWTRVYPTDTQYGNGAPILGTTPSTPTTYYDTSVSTRYIPYVFRNGDWHRVGYVDPGINFTGGVTITDSLAVGVSAPNPLNMTGGGFQTSNTLGINFDMKSIGINAPIRNRWTSTYAMTLNTSNNETGTYELCRNNTAFGGMRIIEDGTVQLGTKGLTPFQLIYNNSAVASVSTGFFDIFPTYNATGQLRVNSKSSIISGVTIGSNGTANNIFMGVSGSAISSGSNNIGLGNSTLNSVTLGQNNVSIGVSSSSSLLSGISNTVIGAAAFSAATLGNSNVVVGDSACGSSVTAHGRVVIGTGADSTSNNAISIGGLSYTSAAGQVSLGFLAKAGLSANNISIGAQAMELAAASDFSLAIGYQSLRSNAGAANVAVGYQSFSTNTTGVRNIGLGAATGISNTTGSDNTFVGSAAGTSNTTGNNNVAVGSQSLWSNTTGNYNTAIGGYALSLSTSGSGNVALGYYALSKNTTGNSNIAIGHQSSLNNTTGVANCSIGYNALTLNTTGNSNIAIGYQCLAKNGGGNSNIGVGVLSLTNNTSGYNNVAIGERALQANSGKSECIAIGTQSLLNYVGEYANPNIAIGCYSQRDTSLYSGSNVSIGHNTLAAISSISRSNSVVGYEAAMTCPNVQFSTVLGSEALRTSLTSVYQTVVIGSSAKTSSIGAVQQSVYIGADSGKLSTQTDTHNTAVGFSSLGGAADSLNSYNTAVGSLAGSEITGSNANSVLIGYQSGQKGTYTSSTLLGAKTIGGPTIGGITRSIVIGAENNTVGTAVSGITDTILIHTGMFSVYSPTAINLNNCIAIGGTPSSVTASGEITLGRSATTSYRMYAAGWSNVSDARDKKNIRPLTEGIDLINKLTPVKFEWNCRDGGRTGDEDSGFIAQDLQEALGSSNDYLKVVNESNPDQLMITKDGLYPVIIKALQELYAENKRLREDLDSLLGK